MISRSYRRRSIWEKGHRRPRSFKKKALTFFLAAAAGFLALQLLLDSTIRTVIEYQGRMFAADLLARETLKILDEINPDYEDLVIMRTDDEGNPVAMETNTAAVNKLKTTLEQRVTQALRETPAQSYSLPLGTLLGSRYLAGRGPDIPLKLSPMGYLNTQLESRFSSGGINQTNHQLILNLSMDLTTVVPLHRSQITASTNLILAETVIVGQVPESMPWFWNTSAVQEQSMAALHLPEQ